MRILTPSATLQLLAAIPPRSPFGARDHAVIRLFAQTGLRVGEMVGLNVGNVYSQAPFDHVDLPAAICKGRHSRIIPLNHSARQAIQDLIDFLKMRGFQANPDSPLLQDRRHRRLPVREVQRLVQVHRHSAGLAVRATPHTFRHSWYELVNRHLPIRNLYKLGLHPHLILRGTKDQSCGKGGQAAARQAAPCTLLSTGLSTLSTAKQAVVRVGRPAAREVAPCTFVSTGAVHAFHGQGPDSFSSLLFWWRSDRPGFPGLHLVS